MVRFCIRKLYLTSRCALKRDGLTLMCTACTAGGRYLLMTFTVWSWNLQVCCLNPNELDLKLQVFTLEICLGDLCLQCGLTLLSMSHRDSIS